MYFSLFMKNNALGCAIWRYIYRMDEIKSLYFHIMFYRLFCGVAKYIVYGNTFSSFEWLRSLHAPTTGRDGETEAGRVHLHLADAFIQR